MFPADPIQPACITDDPLDPDEPHILTRADVSRLLTASRAAHLRKKHSAGRASKDGIIITHPDYSKAESHLAEALRLRQAADTLDPDHTDPAWSEDLAANKGVTSAALIAFFMEYPTIP